MSECDSRSSRHHRHTAAGPQTRRPAGGEFVETAMSGLSDRTRLIMLFQRRDDAARSLASLMDREARLERELTTLLARHAKLANQGPRNTAEDLLDRISKIESEITSDSDGIEKAQKTIAEYDRETAEIKRRIV